MKKTIIFCSIFLASMLLVSSPLSATLVRTDVDTSYVVIDDINDVQWADPDQFTNIVFDEVLTEIGSMNTASFAGSSDWHLASFSELGNLFDEIETVGDARKFNNTWFTGTNYVVNGIYDREVTLSSGPAHTGASFSYPHSEYDSSTDISKNLLATNYRDNTANFIVGAFVVSDEIYTPEPIPEPTTMLLFGTGLLGLVGYGRKKFF